MSTPNSKMDLASPSTLLSISSYLINMEDGMINIKTIIINMENQPNPHNKINKF